MADVWDHPDWLALNAAVVASPYDDLPRLAAADWLDENSGEVKCKNCDGKGHTTGPFGACPCCGGKPPDAHGDRVFGTGRVSNRRQERAEFIRWQVHRSNSGEHNPREGWLWWEYCREWFPGIGHRSGGDPYDLDFVLSGSDAVGVVRRGFVDELRCRLADWIGGECERCDGRGFTYDDADGHVACEACGGINHQMAGEPGRLFPSKNGTGQIVGIGPTIMAEHPVTTVIATEVNIHPARFSGSYDGLIECPEGEAEGWMVPWTAWLSVVPADSPDRWKNLFPTQPLAIKAFSDKLIAACRPKPAKVTS